MTAVLRREVTSFWQGEMAWDVPMAKLSTLAVGGPAAGVAFPGSISELSSLVAGLHDRSIPWWVIGKGSNILVPDEGLAGIVIVLGRNLARIDGPKVSPPLCRGESHTVRVEAGCTLPRLVQWCTIRNLSGLEFAAGIPGSVGGAIAMNAGAWGGEMSTVVESIIAIDRQGEAVQKKREDLAFGYREWKEARSYLIVAAELRLAVLDAGEIRRHCRNLRTRRRSNQPLGAASAGSFFKNPEGVAAGRLIEAAGLKGLGVGGAAVSRKHANFIINTGNAKAADVLQLMQTVQQAVQRTSGIMLEPEVRILRN